MATFNSMKKNRMAQTGAAGIREIAFGYTINTRPGPWIEKIKQTKENEPLLF